MLIFFIHEEPDRRTSQRAKESSYNSIEENGGWGDQHGGQDKTPWDKVRRAIDLCSAERDGSSNLQINMEITFKK